VSTRLDLSWGTRGSGAALEELCRVTNDKLESLPDMQPFTVLIPGTTCIFICISTIFSRAPHFSRGRIYPVHIKIALARAFQAAAARQLCAKLTKRLQKLKLKDMIVMDVVVSGGVASNIFYRILLRFPLLELCTGRCFNTPISPQRLRFNTDNAAMIAWALMHRFLAYDDCPVDLRTKWSIEDIR
ncbi:uncharacterized protein F5891DRAFT_911187, partial [Suillus fuscotomentosus]